MNQELHDSAGTPPPAGGTGRSEVTRQRILRTAERLFAQHGVAGVSLNTINKMARQKNKNAVHYHFGGKAGLLQAIYDKHAPVVAERRRQLFDRLESQGEKGLRPLIRALVQPVAEHSQHPDGGEHYIHISSELSATNTLSYFEPMTDYALRINRDEQFAGRIRSQLQLPEVLIETRMLLVTGMLFHGLSDHLRIRTGAHAPGFASMPLFISNLIDSICAVLQMPPSPQTEALLAMDHTFDHRPADH